MKSLIRVNIAVTVLACGSVISPLSPAQNRQLSIRIGETRNAPPPEPATRDNFQIDAEGEVVIEGRNQSGEIQRRRIQRRIKVAPDIVAETELVNSQSIRYIYSLANRSGARQNIDHFSITTSRPDLITKPFGATKWWLGPSPLDFLPRYNWSSLDTSTDIVAGGTASRFGFEAPLLPGLMKGYFEGRLSEQEAMVGIDNWRLSPWLTEKVGEALMYQNNTVQIPVVGPKFEIATMSTAAKLAEAIAGELLAASAMHEFQEHRLFLENTAASLKTGGKSAAGLSRTVSLMGDSPLQKSFFRAMALNLEYLEKLP